MNLVLTIPLAPPRNWSDVLVAFHKVTSELTTRMLHEITTKAVPKVGDGAVIGPADAPLCIWEVRGD